MDGAVVGGAQREEILRGVRSAIGAALEVWWTSEARQLVALALPGEKAATVLRARRGAIHRRGAAGGLAAGESRELAHRPHLVGLSGGPENRKEPASACTGLTRHTFGCRRHTVA